MAKNGIFEGSVSLLFFHVKNFAEFFTQQNLGFFAFFFGCQQVPPPLDPHSPPGEGSSSAAFVASVEPPGVLEKTPAQNWESRAVPSLEPRAIDGVPFSAGHNGDPPGGEEKHAEFGLLRPIPRGICLFVRGR